MIAASAPHFESDLVESVDLESLSLDRAGYLLIERALLNVPLGGRLAVRGQDPALGVHLGAWARAHGHTVEGLQQPEGLAGVIVRGESETLRWAGAERAGGPTPVGVVERPGSGWGLAPRGSLVEAGAPPLSFDLDKKSLVWAELVPRLYAQAAAAQWDPAVAIDWDAPFQLQPEIESAVVQVMSYLVENETAALIVPAHFVARIHPHFREVLQLLAIQAADEARHIEVFTRRALLCTQTMGVSGAGGRASLGTLLNEPDFALALFLLSVLGEGTFLHLLAFLDQHAPDPVVRQITRLARQDEARHVAFGIAHLEHQLATDPHLRGRLRGAIERRHDTLLDTAGLNQRVFDALIVLAAGAWTPAAISQGFLAVEKLQKEMDEGRQRRLTHLGFPSSEAAALSALHTRNFM